MEVTYFEVKDCQGSATEMQIEGAIGCLQTYKSFRIDNGLDQCINW